MKPKMTAADAVRVTGVTLQAIHKQLRSRELPFQKAQNRVFFGHETARKLFEFPFRQKTLAAQIVKGGTGKTSLLFAVGIRASLYGARVLYVDMDQQGNLTQACNADAEEIPCMVDLLQQNIPIDDAIVPVLPGIDLLPSRIENAVLDNTIMLNGFPLDRVYRDRFDPLRERYDLILVDCPPALGQSVAAVALAVDFVLAPVTPEKFCISGLKVTTSELENVGKKYGREIPMSVAINKFDNRTVLSHETLTTLVKSPRYGDRLFKSYVRASQEFPNSVARDQTVFDTLRQTSAKEDVDLLVQEILEIGDFAPEQRKDN